MHPDSVCKIFDNYSAMDSKNNLAEKHPEIIKKAIAIFKHEHVRSKWYLNPGESNEDRKKLKKYVVERNLINKSETLY